MSVILTALLLPVTLPPAMASTSSPARDYSSFFTDSVLMGSGWSPCPQPVTWSVDVRHLTTTAATREIRRLQRAMSQWSLASGIPMDFIGRQKLTYDTRVHHLNPADGSTPQTRHIYIGFYGSKEVPGLAGNVIGLAMPTSVVVSDRELVSGMAVFRSGYVTRQQVEEPRRLAHLYLHELGHIFGLGHATTQANVMYPTLGTMTDLGPGDRDGVRAFTQTRERCAA